MMGFAVLKMGEVDVQNSGRVKTLACCALLESLCSSMPLVFSR
jgi:hypothetical protein